MIINYRENASTNETRTAQDLLDDKELFSSAEKKAFYTLTKEEIKYLKEDCFINRYIDHLRKGNRGEANGVNFPILVVKGTKLQLERFKMVFLLSLVDFKGIKVFHPVDFQLGRDSYQEAQDFTGVAIIKIPFGSSTTENFDQFRSDLITDVLTVRRENFNPTLVLTEQAIAGALNESFDLIKVITLDVTKLRGSYKGVSRVDTTVASRQREIRTCTPIVTNTAVSNNTQNAGEQKIYKSSYSNNKYKKKEKAKTVIELAEERKKAEMEQKG